MQSAKVNKNALDFNYIFLDVQVNKPAILFLSFFFIFSSPEQEVLMMSYCGQSMSVVLRVASTIA